MTKTLLISILTMALGLAACSGSETRPGRTAGTGGASVGGSGGSGGPGGTGGSAGTGGNGGSVSSGAGGFDAAVAWGGNGGSGGGSPDALAGGGPDSMRSADVTPMEGAAGWAKCGPETFKVGVSAAEFCARYMTVCMFDAAGGAGGKSRYKSLDDCMSKYSALSDGPRGGKACVAYHLCVAGFEDTRDTFCPNPPAASAMSGPCKTSYL